MARTRAGQASRRQDFPTAAVLAGTASGVALMLGLAVLVDSMLVGAVLTGALCVTALGIAPRSAAGAARG